MLFKNVYLTNASGTAYSLTRLFNNAYDVYDAIEDSMEGKTLVEKLKCTKNYFSEIILERDNERTTRIKLIDSNNGNFYLVVYK